MLVSLSLLGVVVLLWPALIFRARPHADGYRLPDSPPDSVMPS